jgi:hypothetical protein
LILIGLLDSLRLPPEGGFFWILASWWARVEFRGRLSRANHLGGANTSPWVVLRNCSSNRLEVGVPGIDSPLQIWRYQSLPYSTDPSGLEACLARIPDRRYAGIILQIRLADWIASMIFLIPSGSREIGTHLMMSLQEDTEIEQVMWNISDCWWGLVQWKFLLLTLLDNRSGKGTIGVTCNWDTFQCLRYIYYQTLQ